MDKHKTGRISQILAIVVSVFFLFIAVNGYQRTGDISVFLLFSLLAVMGYFIVKFLFLGVNKLLDSLEDKHNQRSK
ncbi:hypothetical protein Q4508_04215 [Amphritea sp. 2_MG-2023]|uniref:hypothetical protein n=1 Tax=Amphritea TaxID=515417 RepID=UPI001C06F156|nr:MULTISPECIES: hypothetical protein [Amphritea]MBU2964426.1 hypothetical protein [Amphritea atlantica]MDO6417754.1 hypothetical protein [Amphritea sp. 2_MG-2023]